jgi:hypothetical protein
VRARASAVVLSFVFVAPMSWRVILTWTECLVVGRWNFALALGSLSLVFVVGSLSVPRCEMWVQIVPES